jgi:hypothetical protein
MKKKIIFNAIKVSLVIGTLLNLINNYDAVFHGKISFAICLKVIITYFIPFSVSYYSSRKALSQNSVAH